jgi:hypothetical protein
VKSFNLVLNPDVVMMGIAMPAQAKKLGAKTLVHLSFPRHMSNAMISARYRLLAENCAKLGLDFITYAIPDPTGDIGRAGAQRVALEEIPKLIKEYGEDTAFFCTSCGLQQPVIVAVVDAHGIYPQPCCPSPFHGFPDAFGLVSQYKDAEGNWMWNSIFDEFGTNDTVKVAVAKITEKLHEKRMLGRVSTWPVPVAMMNTVAAAEYAIKWINGEAPREGIDIAVLEQCMADYTGVECFTRTLGTHEADIEIIEGAYPNWILVREDYLTFGEEEYNFFAPVSGFSHDSEFLIEDGLLLKYNGHAENVTIPAGTIGIANEAFMYNKSLRSVKMPDSITFIDNNAFAHCSNLQDITIPNSVTSIGWGAFYYCSSLQAITIPNSVEEIDLWTFHGCSSLQEIIIPVSVKTIWWFFGGCENLTIHCPAGSYAAKYAKENNIPYVITK